MAKVRNIAIFSLLSWVVLAGCISSPVILPEGGQILMSSNPTTVVLDEFANPPVTTLDVVISAQFLNAGGVPEANVSAVFTADGGTLASSPPGQPAATLETDDNGFVSDTLTVQLGDPDTITVTVRSGSATQTISIDKDEVAPNQPPLAALDITPSNSALLNQAVIFDATFSDDPDGDPITCYQWQIETSENISSPALPCVPPNSRCEVSQGPATSILTRSYSVEQSIAVTLRVSDDPSLVCSPSGPVEAATAFGGVAVDSYDIVCDRSAPTAGAGPNQSVSLGGNPSVNVPLSGATSFDSESGIVSYNWDCGNGTGPMGGIAVTCNYTSTGVYSVLLTVTNGCGQTSVDTVVVTVNP